MRQHDKPNMDAGCVRRHTQPTTRRKRSWVRSLDEHDWLERRIIRRVARQPQMQEDTNVRG